jgi:hypothetical protein
MKCPHCTAELTTAQLKSLWGAYTASIMTDKRKADLSNRSYRGGGWPKGKPRGAPKPKQEKHPTNESLVLERIFFDSV